MFLSSLHQPLSQHQLSILRPVDAETFHHRRSNIHHQDAEGAPRFVGRHAQARFAPPCRRIMFVVVVVVVVAVVHYTFVTYLCFCDIAHNRAIPLYPANNNSKP